MNALNRLTESWPLHARFDGPIVMIGFGSIGRGTVPLIERHIAFDRTKFAIIAPDNENQHLAAGRSLRFVHTAVTQENYRDLLGPLLAAEPGRGMIVNLSVDTSSVDLMAFAKDIDAFYLDTVVEPWPGLYTDQSLSPSARSNYALREGILELRRRRPGGVTGISCCGANPGMVSWLVKQALLDIARDLRIAHDEPQTRETWGRLMQRVGIKGIHIAERDTQRGRQPKARGKFVNTWSVEGFIAEGLQPSELGWGTHERTLPPGGRHHEFGCDAAIYLSRPGAGTRVRSWTPTAQAQHAWMIPHNESSLCGRTEMSSIGRHATTRTIPAMMRCSPCTRWRARNGSRRNRAISYPRRTSSMESTSSACCSMGMPKMLIGTALTFLLRRRARLHHFRTPPGCRSARRCSQE
jgi:homospermidine synthase